MQCNGLPTQAGSIPGAADAGGGSPYTARPTVLADRRLYHQHRERDADGYSHHISGENPGYLGMDAERCPGTATRPAGSWQAAGRGPAVVAASTRCNPCSHSDKRRPGYRSSCLSTGHHLHRCIIREAPTRARSHVQAGVTPKGKDTSPLQMQAGPLYWHTVATDRSSTAYCKFRFRCGIILRRSLSDREV